MINIAELLKDAPKGLKLYSPLLGEVEFAEVMDTDYVPIRVMKRGYGLRFDEYGRYMGNEYPDSECLLFPSKEVRTWEGWKLHKPHYDISNFKPFDKVLGRISDINEWRADYFSHLRKNSKIFAGIGHSWFQCIPYNEDTKHLLGTTDMCPEEYINW